jgi:hypothetical protein
MGTAHELKGLTRLSVSVERVVGVKHMDERCRIEAEQVEGEEGEDRNGNVVSNNHQRHQVNPCESTLRH